MPYKNRSFSWVKHFSNTDWFEITLFQSENCVDVYKCKKPMFQIEFTLIFMKKKTFFLTAHIYILSRNQFVDGFCCWWKPNRSIFDLSSITLFMSRCFFPPSLTNESTYSTVVLYVASSFRSRSTRCSPALGSCKKMQKTCSKQGKQDAKMDWCHYLSLQRDLLFQESA